MTDEWPTRYLRKRSASLPKYVSAKNRHCMTYLDIFPVQIRHLLNILYEMDPAIVYASCVAALLTKP